MPPEMASLTLMWGWERKIQILSCEISGQDQGKRSAGQEEGGAAQAAGRPEKWTVPAPCGKGDRWSCFQAFKDVRIVCVCGGGWQHVGNLSCLMTRYDMAARCRSKRNCFNVYLNEMTNQSKTGFLAILFLHGLTWFVNSWVWRKAVSDAAVCSLQPCRPQVYRQSPDRHQPDTEGEPEEVLQGEQTVALDCTDITTLCTHTCLELKASYSPLVQDICWADVLLMHLHLLTKNLRLDDPNDPQTLFSHGL